MDNKQLCLNLAYCESERDVIKLLKNEGYWDNSEDWRYYGDNENNFATIGNQQSKPEAAIVEKIINSVDAVLMSECLSKGINPESPEAPKSIIEALEKFFKIDYGKLSNITPAERSKLANKICLVSTGRKTNPCYSIIDMGEGQTPNKMPDTLLSIGKSNKLRIPFVQGKFNMGGTGVFQFCGKRNLQLIILSVIVFLSLTIYDSPSYAIPAFARRYRTSCSSCHVIIPKLNHFGKAFKANGYRIPPKDEAFIKIPDVKLGDEEWKEVWPKGVWPGSIPGLPPIALRIDGDLIINPKAEVNSDFDIPREIEILAGGHAGDGFSYFFELAFEHDAIALERAFAQFDHIAGMTLLNIKVGRYELAAVPFSRFSRKLTASDFITSDYRAVPGGFRFRDRQQGIEFWGARSGTLGGGFEYGVGIVNGSGSRRDVNSAKDIYYRFSYKFGGFGVAGSKNKKVSRTFQQTNNWRDDSFKIGTFGYRGTGVFSERENKFDRLGFDFDAWYRNLNLFGAFVHGRELKNSAEKFSFNAYFVEAEYVLLPWVIAILRYDHAGNRGSSIQRIVPAIVLAYRANVRLVNEVEIYLADSGDSLFRIRLDFLF